MAQQVESKNRATSSEDARQQVVAKCKTEGIESMLLWFTDLEGHLKRFALPPDEPAEVLDRLPYGHRENVRTTSISTLAVVRRLNRLGPRTDVNPVPLADSKLVARLADRLVRTDPLGARSKAAEERLRRQADEWAGDRYAASNARLAELIGVDLARYGWRV